jgi:hypothetical protein
MSDTKWLTYDEAAVSLRISPESVRRLAQRRKWPRRPGNDGKARLGVPAERIDAVVHAAGDTSGDAAPDATRGVAPGAAGDDARDTALGAAAVVALLTRHVERLEVELAVTKSERDAAQARISELAAEVKDNLTSIADLTAKAGRADVLKALLEGERRRVEEVRGIERQGIEELKAERDRWAAIAEASQRQITHLTEKRRGWWPFRRAS